MSRKKEKVKFFERIVIEDPTYAEAVCEKESNRFKINLIFTALAAVATLVFYIGQTEIGDLLFVGIFDMLSALIYGIGVIATVLTGPKNIIKLIWKCGLFGYWIVPLWIVDLGGFVAGLCLAFIALLTLPIVYALYNLYQTYMNMKDTKEFLETSKMFNS